MTEPQFVVVRDELKPKNYIIIPMWLEESKYVAFITRPHIKHEILEVILEVGVDAIERFFNNENIEFYSGGEDTEQIEDIWEAHHGFHEKG